MKIYKIDDMINNGEYIHIFTANCTREIMIHTHDFIELVYVVSGSAIEVVNGEEYSVKQGDVIFINCGGLHSFRPSDHLVYYNVCFLPDLMANSIITPDNAFPILLFTAFNEMRGETESGLITFKAQERKTIEALFEMMLLEQQEKKKNWNIIMESCLNIIITRMLRKTQICEGEISFDSTWSELLEFIDTNLDSDLSLSMLARKCFYNPSYFSRVFKEKFGVSPITYINQKRVGYAAELLRSTDVLVNEICHRCGFADRSSFYRIFTKYIGVAPSEYRKKYLQ